MNFAFTEKKKRYRQARYKRITGASHPRNNNKQITYRSSQTQAGAHYVDDSCYTQEHVSKNYVQGINKAHKHILGIGAQDFILRWAPINQHRSIK